MSNSKTPKLIVIGAGFGGIASALRMRAKGYEVTLIERNDQLGGRARVFEHQGFRHDAGPTVLTAPFLFDELFELFGKNRQDYVTFIPLDPWYRFVFPDGKTFDYGGTQEKIHAEIRKFNPDDIRGYNRMVEKSRQIFEVGFDKLSDRPFHSMADMVAQIPALIRLKSWQTVWQFVSSHIKDPYLRKAFSISPLLVGGNPFETTNIYALIHYLERKWGIHFAKGGTGAIVTALEKLMAEEGIEILKSTTITDMRVSGKTVTGVITGQGREIPCDKVIFNGDPGYLFRNILKAPAVKTSARIKSRYARHSMGLFVLYFGTTQKYPDLAHHTIWFGERYKSLLKDIFTRKILPEDFSLYLHRPTATDPDFAPGGCDSFYVLAPVPNLLSGTDWTIEGPKHRDRIVAALDRTIMPGLKKTITADFYMTPADFERDYLSVHGSGFSIAPYFTQSAWFRYHNLAEGPDNLYLCGAGTHPGAGLPGVLSSARVLDRLIPEISDNYRETA